MPRATAHTRLLHVSEKVHTRHASERCSKTANKSKRKNDVAVSKCANVRAHVLKWLTLEAFMKQQVPRRRAFHWLAKRTWEVEAAAKASARGARSRSIRADGWSPNARAAAEREREVRKNSVCRERTVATELLTIWIALDVVVEDTRSSRSEKPESEKLANYAKGIFPPCKL